MLKIRGYSLLTKKGELISLNDQLCGKTQLFERQRSIRFDLARSYFSPKDKLDCQEFASAEEKEVILNSILLRGIEQGLKEALKLAKQHIRNKTFECATCRDACSFKSHIKYAISDAYCSKSCKDNRFGQS